MEIVHETNAELKMRKSKNTQHEAQIPTQPRLVKAGQQAAVAEARPEVKKAPVIDPALRRTPRNANEARSMFEALFGNKAA